VKASVTFVVKDSRRRDGDNLLSSIKAGIDGLVDGFLLKDDSMGALRLSIDLERGPKACVRIVLEEERI
jgi:hypothetical protein